MNDDWDLNGVGLGVLDEAEPEHNQAGGKIDGIEPGTVHQQVGWQRVPVPAGDGGETLVFAQLSK